MHYGLNITTQFFSSFWTHCYSDTTHFKHAARGNNQPHHLTAGSEGGGGWVGGLSHKLSPVLYLAWTPQWTPRDHLHATSPHEFFRTAWPDKASSRAAPWTHKHGRDRWKPTYAALPYEHRTLPGSLLVSDSLCKQMGVIVSKRSR